MKKIIILISALLVGSAHTKTNYSVKYSLIENPFLIKDGYMSELNPNIISAENIAKNTKSLTLGIDYRPKKKVKALGFRIIPKLKLDGEFYLFADFDRNSSQYRLLNRDGSNDKVRKAELEASVVAVRKLSKKSVLFFNLGAMANSSYDIQFDTVIATGRIYDYGLISTSHQEYFFEVGYQAKLNRHFRVDAKYKFAISEYTDDYSIFDVVAGQNNDNFIHRVSLNTNLKFNKLFNLDLDTSASHQVYQNKLAFKDNGFVQSSGLVEAQSNSDYSVSTRLNLKPSKIFRPYISARFFMIDDKVTSANDVEILSFDLGTTLKFSKKLSANASYSIKSIDYATAIASLENEADTTLLHKDINSIKLGLTFKSFSFDYSNVKNDSTREYDNINHSTYGLSYSSTF